MELLSAPLHTGSVPWQRLLLTVSLITYWSSPTTAQVHIDPVPPHVAEGKSVLLRVSNLPENLLIIRWYKGKLPLPEYELARYIITSNENKTGPAYSGRETIFPNGSLLFQNVNQNDTGFYTFQITTSVGDTEQLSLKFDVYPLLPKPHITSNNSNPTEGEDSVALTCEPETPSTSYLWRINGQNLSDGDRLELLRGNRTLLLLSVTRNDTGPYECETRNPVSANTSDPVTLNVSYGPDVPILSPSDSYFRLGTNLNLSCLAASNPPAQYSWLINGEPQPSSQDLFIPNITTNHSGSYTCIVHNSATGLTRTAVKDVTVLEPVTQPSLHITNNTVPEKGSVVFSCRSNDTGISIQWIFNNQNLKLTERMTLSENNSRLSIEPVMGDDAGDYQCEVSNPVSSEKSAPVHLVVNTAPEPGSSGLPAGAIAGIVVGVVAGVALIAALVYFLYSRKTGRWLEFHEFQGPATKTANSSLPIDSSTEVVHS